MLPVDGHSMRVIEHGVFSNEGRHRNPGSSNPLMAEDVGAVAVRGCFSSGAAPLDFGRHLDTSQRAMIGAKIATIPHGGDRKSKDQEPKSALDIVSAAALVNVGKESVKDARTVLSKGSAETIAKVERARGTLFLTPPNLGPLSRLRARVGDPPFAPAQIWADASPPRARGTLSPVRVSSFPTPPRAG